MAAEVLKEKRSCLPCRKIDTVTHRCIPGRGRGAMVGGRVAWEYKKVGVGGREDCDVQGKVDGWLGGQVSDVMCQSVRTFLTCSPRRQRR